MTGIGLKYLGPQIKQGHANAIPSHSNAMGETRGRRQPPCGVKRIEMYVHGVGMSLFDPGGTNIPILPSSQLSELGALAPTL